MHDPSFYHHPSSQMKPSKWTVVPLVLLALAVVLGCLAWGQNFGSSSRPVPVVTPSKVSMEVKADIVWTKVYVLNRMPSDWPVKDGLKVIDAHTKSSLIYASACPANSRCYVIKPGKMTLPGDHIGETIHGETISQTLIDVNKAKATGLYGYSTKRWLLAHEAGHAFGLRAHHTGCGYVMYPYRRCGGYVPGLAFTTGEKAVLKGF